MLHLFIKLADKYLAENIQVNDLYYMVRYMICKMTVIFDLEKMYHG